MSSTFRRKGRGGKTERAVETERKQVKGRKALRSSAGCLVIELAISCELFLPARPLLQRFPSSPRAPGLLARPGEPARAQEECQCHPLEPLQWMSTVEFRKHSSTHHRASEGLGVPFCSFPSLVFPGARLTRVSSGFLHLPGVWSWARSFTSLCLLFI